MHEGKHGILDDLEEMDDLFGSEQDGEENEHECEHGHKKGDGHKCDH